MNISPAAEDRVVVVVVVGGGLAGLSAALEAQRHGASEVVLLEQEARIGGNSAKASSGCNGAGTAAQRKHGVEDSAALLEEDTLKSGRGDADAALVKILAQESAEAIQFLEQEGGLDMSVLTLLGGASRARAHRPKFPEGQRPTNLGFALVNALRKRLEALPRVRIVTGARVTRLLSSPFKVTGVAYTLEGTEVEQQAHTVILATGGFSADSEGLMKEYAPHLKGMPTTNADWVSTGDGIRWGKALGAKLALMECVQVHPTGLVDPSHPNALSVILAGEALRGDGGLLINSEGNRFINELGYRDVVSDAILANCSPIKVEGGTTPVSAYLLLNKQVAAKFPEAIGFYSFKKLVKRYTNLSAFSEATGVPKDNLSTTFQQVNDAIAGVSADPCGRTKFGPKFSADDELIVLVVTPSRHYTMGGLEIDEKAQVISEHTGKPMQGLRAAGEVTGGLHGCNRLGGNSLLECIVFGRRAGKLLS